MLDLRSDCELCGKDLPPEAPALICSFECTWCTDHGLETCPNCGGKLETRPVRPPVLLDTYPPSTIRKFKG
jgi:uncharacterized protein